MTTTTDNPALTELIAEQLCHTRVIDGQHHRFEAVDHGDGRIELAVTRFEFAAEADTTMRLLLQVSPIAPTPTEQDGVEIGASV